MRHLALLGALVVACTSQPLQSSSSQPSAACRLAVVQGGQGSGAQTPGFLTLPGGVFTAAHSAGTDLYYDRAVKQWIPSPYPAVPALSPDGTRYAYVDGDAKTSRAHLVDLRTGSDVVVASGGPWRGVGLDADWFYVMRIDYVDTNAFGRIALGKGLWSLPLAGGTPVQLTTDARGWLWVVRGGVYGAGYTTDVAGGPNDVVRLDTGTGQTAVWLDKHARSRLLAVDGAGVAFVMTEAADEQLWRVTRPGNSTLLWSGPPDAIRPDYPVAVDGSDVWFSGSSLSSSWAIYHFSPREGLKQVLTFTDRRVVVAGPCS